MNADGEWNDARQSLFAPIYLEYYRETGLPEYFERGVSALRASFVMLVLPGERAGLRGLPQSPPLLRARELRLYDGEHRPRRSRSQRKSVRLRSSRGGMGRRCRRLPRCSIAAGTCSWIRRGGRLSEFDGCQAAVTDGQVRITDPYKRSELTVVFRSGKRKRAKLHEGSGTLRLE